MGMDWTLGCMVVVIIDHLYKQSEHTVHRAYGLPYEIDTSAIAGAWDAWWQGTVALCLLYLVLWIPSRGPEEL